MIPRVVAASFGLVAALVSLHLAGIVIAQQARDSGRPPVVGTGSISGVVLDDAQPARPVRRAVVTLTGEGLHPGRGAITDDEGRFTLRGLPAGRFTLTAERGGYVTSVFGAKRPGRAGTAITIADGQRLVDLRLRLWRGAVITGVLHDEAGEPIANIGVSAIPAREVSPVTLTLSNNNQVRTNDLGEFRIFGLEPGAYVVRAGQEGLISTVAAVSEADVDAAFAALAARTGQRGTALTPAAGKPGDRIGMPTTAFGWAPIFFPGTATAADAETIVLQPGEERRGVDFAYRRVRTGMLRGTIDGPDGAPVPGTFVELTTIAGPGSFGGVRSAPIPATADADGSFRIGPIPPGEYRLMARGAVSGTAWWTESTVAVQGGDVDLGRLRLGPGMTFSGRVILDRSATSPPPGLAGLRVQLMSDSLRAAPSGSRGARGGGSPGPRFLQPAIVAEDGTFAVRDLIPDTYRVMVTGAGVGDAGWWLRAATHQDRDLLDAPLRITARENVTGVTVLLSDRRTGLSGTLLTPGGAAVSDVFVLVFPADATMRQPQSRRVRAVRPDSSGRFVFTNLPAGDYLLCALTDVDDGQWNEAGFFDPLVPASVKIALGDGEKKVQDLRVAGG